MATVDLDQRAQYDITTVVSCLQQQLDVTQHENQQLKQSITDQNEQYQRDHDYLELRVKGIIQENDSLYSTQGKLESDLYAKEQELDILRKETQIWKRLHKELNKSLETEREEFDNDRSSWLQRESQLTDTIRLLQQQRQQKDHPQSTPSSKQRSHLFPAYSAPCIPSFMENLDYTPDTGCQKTVVKLDSTHDSQTEGHLSSSTMESLESTNQETIKAQENIITTLKTELKQQANKLQQQRVLENHQVSIQVKHLMAEVDNIKQLNQALMEENESYQMLLHEKTISGDFISDSIMQCQDDYFSYNKDQEKLLQGENLSKSKKQCGLNLADELALASTGQTNSTKNSVLSTEEELLGEIKTLQDANRALQLYMNKILLRIVENKHLENILSIDEPNKGHKATTTIIKSTTPPPHLQTSLNTPDDQQRHTPLKQVNSCHSFSSVENMSRLSTSSDASSTKTMVESGDGGSDTTVGGDNSWTQVFRRMSSGFTGWTKSNDTVSKSPVVGLSSVQVDYEIRTLFLLNK